MKLDTFIIGHLSIDEIVLLNGDTSFSAGGAVVYSTFSAVAAGNNNVGILIKTGKKEKMIIDLLPVRSENLNWIESKAGTTSIRNEFLDDKFERRITKAICQGDKITLEDIPKDVSSKVFQLAGLMYGDYEDEMIPELAKRGKVALDMQCYLRRPDKDTREMVYGDWDRKKEFFPYITYLKTDAAEAEILTGETDRRKAAKMMVDWGVKEALITHNTEVLVYDGKDYYTCPLMPKSLAGRTGRGDTTFAAYITERERCGIQEALNYASALVSLKIATPGPFKGNRADVEEFMRENFK